MMMLRCTNKDCANPLKDETEFYTHNKRPNGRHAWCKECSRVSARKYVKERADDPVFREKRKAIHKKHRHSEAGRIGRRRWLSSDSGKRSRKSMSRSPRARFSAAKSSAKSRGIWWGLEFSDWVSLVAGMDCHYCWGPLNECGSGLDRKDSEVAYVQANSVPCCHDCNIAKNDNFSYEEMVEFIGPAIRAAREKRKRTDTMSGEKL